MKRLAIFIGGLLVMPAFAEVAPVFIDENDAIEYADGMYDENGFFVTPEEIVETETEADTQKMQTPVKISRAPVNATPVANRTTSTRAMPASAGATTASGRGSANGNSSRVVAARTTTNVSGRGNTSRAVASRGTTNSSPRTTATTSTTRTTINTAASRAAAARATGGSARTTATSGAGVARTGTVARTATAARAGTARATTTKSSNISRAATTDASRPSVRGNIDVGAGLKAGATITASNGVVMLDSNSGSLYNASAVRRTPTVRMSSLKDATESTITMSMEDMDDLAEMTDYCKAQYASCMDNYCNVLDDNQGRCSCSANLKNYAKAEQALKTATEELQDVAQKIQYIGLTTREVETLFTQTEAELAMQSKTDTSQLQASLDKIKDMIIDVKTGNATSGNNTDLFGLNFDLSGLLEFSFDSTGFDLGSLFGTTNTNSVSNQRGEELFKTAAARCKTSVLKACTARGVDASLVTNAYDLEIDRECIAYERSLNDSNDQMIATVRNAKNVLQKARLMVAQQKNAYDLRGCINALDECMQDEFVCGSEYENCLDPTGRYIVNGAVVVGSQPGHAIDPDLPQNVASTMTSDVCRVNLYRTWDIEPGVCTPHTVDGAYSTYVPYPTADQGNAWGSGKENDNLVYYIEQTVKTGAAQTASENMSKYLQNKIGYIDKNGRAHGMCISVLNKCQDYSYDAKGTSAKYKEDNDVIKQYLGRVLVQIKAKQDEILANYAETCVADVTSCLSQNGYPTEDPSEWETELERTQNIVKQNIAVNACRAQVVTCMSVNGYSISTPTPTEMNCWVQGLLYNYTTKDCLLETDTEVSCGPGALSLCGRSNCESNGGYWCDTNTYCYSTAPQYNNNCTSSGGGTTTECWVTLAGGNGCGSATPINIACDKTTYTNIHGFVSDDNDNRQVWSCQGNNNALATALNNMGGASGIGTLDNLSSYGITQPTTCTATCYTPDVCNVTFAPGIGCGSSNPYTASCEKTTATTIGKFSDTVKVQTWHCSGNNDYLEDALNELGNETGIGSLGSIAALNVNQSPVCTAMCYGVGSDNGYPTVTVNCGSNNTFNNLTPSDVDLIYGGTSFGTFRKANISATGNNNFSFMLDDHYCFDGEDRPNKYKCNNIEYDANASVTVNSDMTCVALYSKSGSGGDDPTTTPQWINIMLTLDEGLTVEQGNSFFYDTTETCDLKVYYPQPSGNTCPTGGFPSLTLTNNKSCAFEGFYGSSAANATQYITSTGLWNWNSLGGLVSGMSSPIVLYPRWTNCTDDPDTGDTNTVNLTIDCGTYGTVNVDTATVNNSLTNTDHKKTIILDKNANYTLNTNLCTPTSGYGIEYWCCKPGTNADITVTPCTTTFAANGGNGLPVSQDYTCKAHIATTYVGPDDGHNITITYYNCDAFNNVPGISTSWKAENTSIDLRLLISKAIPNDNDVSFTCSTTTGKVPLTNGVSFNMPAEDVTCTATCNVPAASTYDFQDITLIGATVNGAGSD